MPALGGRREAPVASVDDHDGGTVETARVDVIDVADGDDIVVIPSTPVANTGSRRRPLVLALAGVAGALAIAAVIALIAQHDDSSAVVRATPPTTIAVPAASGD